VGEIEDEFDTEQHARRSEERVWVVPGMMRRDEAERLTGGRLPEGEAETVSGVVVEHLGRLLERGDQLTTEDGWRLTVLSIDGRRAGEVEIRAPEGASEDAEDE
jgi:CBS domain containing-hemolysin-like protein